MKSILITGCNRGIGLGLVKYLSEEKNSLQHIIATCRNPTEAPVRIKDEINPTLLLKYLSRN